jgi:hypothetical protein
MVYRLKPVRISDDLLRLRLGWGWRVFFVGVALFIGGVRYFVGALGLPAAAVGLVSAVAAFYQESWLFDRLDRSITSRIGLVFLCRTRCYETDRLRRLVVRIRSGGSGSSVLTHTGLITEASPVFFQRGFASLVLVFEAGSNQPDPYASAGSSYRVMIQTEALRNQDRIRECALILSEFLGLEITEET